MEVGDRDRSLEDADGDIMSGVFSFGPYPVCGSFGRRWPRSNIFTGAVLCRGWTGAVREGVCRDWGGLGGAEEIKENEKTIETI